VYSDPESQLENTSMPVSGIRDKQPGPLLMGARWAISAICEKREEFLCIRSEMSAQI